MSQAPRYRIVAADWSHDEAAIRQVRTAVFVDEQGIPEALEWDGRDADCLHVLALSDAGEAIATGRLQVGGRIGRMAVLPSWRGMGVGRGILSQLLALAGRQGLQRVHVHAQLGVAGFYYRAGFRTAGRPFMAAGIAHVKMVKRLDSA